jgi:hypothetical protein
MTPLLKSLNVGLPTRIASAKPWTSGIYKSPEGALQLSKLSALAEAWRAGFRSV